MKKFLLSAFLLVLVTVVAALYWLRQDMEMQLATPLPVSTPQLLVLHKGQSLTALAETLVNRGWLAHPWYFIYEGRRQGRAASLKSGEYTIEPGTTPLQLLDILVAGKVRQYSLTIPEGLTFRQILDIVRSEERLIQTLDGLNPKMIMARLGYSGYFPEGRIHPDTYLFPAGTRDADFLLRAIRTQERILGDEWRDREPGLPYASPYQALIMASIIEKETAVPEERSKIAGVFVRRLRKNMKLQTDPTVIYAMAERFDGNIRRRDLSIDSPYNTYRYRGLPPTPIASPGRESIHAALHPEEGEALYFVARGDGSHYFSATLKEHNQAVARYQLNRE